MKALPVRATIKPMRAQDLAVHCTSQGKTKCMFIRLVRRNALVLHCPGSAAIQSDFKCMQDVRGMQVQLVWETAEGPTAAR